VVPQTTAELLLRAAEATYVLGTDATTSDVAEFIGGTEARAENALAAARELGFVRQGSNASHWTAQPGAQLLASSTPAEKAVLLRFQLDRFAPYALFKARIAAGEQPKDAARQVCIANGSSADPLDVEETLLNLASYSGGLVYGADREVLIAGDVELLKGVLAIHETVMATRDTVQAHIARKLGVEAASFATGEVLDALVDSYLTVLGDGPYDQSMFQLGKGLEAWVKALATIDPPITVPSNVNTMGAVANLLRGGNRTTGKHHSMLLGVIAVRNAADHSIDPDIDATWEISQDTAIAVSHLVWSIMRSFFASRDGRHVL